MVGYRNAVYMPKTKAIRVYSWDNLGNRISYDVSYEPYVCIEDRSGTHMSIFNTKLKKKTFNNQYERGKFVKDSSIKRIFENIAPVQQYLIDTYWKDNETTKFSEFPLRVIFMDIEVQIENEFPSAEHAKYPINIISLHDSLTNKFYAWGLNDYNHSRTDLEYKKCDSERELLKEFADFIRNSECDLLTGWNVEGFDIPYVVNRINNVFGENKAVMLSPVNNVYPRIIPTMFGKPQTRWYIDGICCVDYLDMYKRFRLQNRESYKLNYIAEAEDLGKKVDYGSSNLGDLARNNWQLFVDYNLQDVNLLVLLDNKLHYVELLRMLAYMGCSTLEGAMSVLSVTTGAAAIRARRRNQLIPTFVRDITAGKNPGAYVSEPKKGFQKNIVSFDANSLYPNIMISLNMSPETKIGKIIEKTESKISIRHVNGQIFDLTPDKFKEFIKKEKIAVSRADILFSQKHMGILPDLVDHYYKERQKVRAEMQKNKKKMLSADEEEKKTLNNLVVQLNARQMCLKVAINAAYGYFGNKHAPMGDDDIASSITLTGQDIIKQSNIIGAKFTGEMCGSNKEIDATIMNDTDSAYFSITPILEAKGITLAKGNFISKEANDIIQQFNDRLNSEIKKWVKENLNSLDPRIVFKREAIADVGIFLEKKRYVIHVIDDEGIQSDKWKYTGVAVVRTAMPKAIKPYVKKIIETMLSTQDRLKTNEVVNETYEVLMSLTPEEIGFASGITDYDKFASKSNGMSTPKGTPVHVKAAHYHNVIIDKLGIDSKYEKIGSGEKMRYFYVKTPNMYGTESIGFKHYYPKEFENIFNIDHEKMFDKIVFSVVESFYSAVNWSAHKVNEQVKCDLLQLFN